MSGQQHAPAAIYPWKNPVPILQEAGWAPGPVWMGRKSHPHRDSIPDRPACSQSLYRLRYPSLWQPHLKSNVKFPEIFAPFCLSLSVVLLIGEANISTVLKRSMSSNISLADLLHTAVLHKVLLYRVILSLEAPNYCLCIQSNSAGFCFVNTGKQVYLKHARRHFERNLVKDVHHRNVAYRNWLKS